jgi:hypothetical protein
MSSRLINLGLAVAMVAGSCGVAVASPANPWQRGNDQSRRATHALNMLEAQGYGDFSHFRKAGDDFTANVMKDGRTMQVLVNPDTNQIQPEGGSSRM